MKAALLLLACIAFSALVVLADAQTPSSQVNALNDVYNDLAGRVWGNHTNWLKDDPCLNNWYGVSCRLVTNDNANYTTVIGLRLRNNNLQNTMPESMSDLVDLEILDFADNYISGTIASSIFDLYSIQTIDLSNNKIGGQISFVQPSPASRFLAFFNVSHNSFTGDFPSFASFSALETLDITFNSFGPKLNAFTDCSSLKNFNASFNSFSGDLPSFSGSLSIENFDVHSNDFSGFVSTSFSTLAKLKVFDLSSNNFQGNIPSYFADGLVRLNVSFNAFSGSVPTFSSTASLLYFDISHNNFTGAFPSAVATLPMITEINVSYNQLASSVPSFASPYGYIGWPLNKIDLSYNQFSSALPNITAPNLKYLDLSNNDFSSGDLSSYSGLTNLHYFDLSNNEIEGTFGMSFYCFQAQYINISDNLFSGTLPAFYTLNQLTVFDASNNNFFNYIPLTLPDSIVTLNLQNNNLTGGVSGNYFRSLSLETLNLGYNSLQGTLPATYGATAPLHFLDLSHNQFSGSIPNELGNFKLTTLLLNDNNFDGDLPNFLHFVPDDILDFDAHDNMFSCPLPTWCDADTGNGLCSPCYESDAWLWIAIIVAMIVVVVCVIIAGVGAFIYIKGRRSAQALNGYQDIVQDNNYSSPTVIEDYSFGKSKADKPYSLN